MKIEDELGQAMRAHVADVSAPPDLGRTVRRRHRAHVLRFRAAGAAVAVAAVAVAVPVTFGMTSSTAGPAANPAAGQDQVVVRDDVTVPDVTGQTATDAVRMLGEAGLVAETSKDIEDTVVTEQRPAAGERVPYGSGVTLTVLPRAAEPQDLGDLGDGREFGGIRLGYLPEGLVWGKWSGKDGFGKNSYTTSFNTPDAKPGHYAVQVMVFEGQAAEDATAKFPKDARKVDVGGRDAWLATMTDGGEVVPDGTSGGTLTIGFELRDGLAVEVCLSPDYAGRVDGPAELKKVAEGIRATG